MMLMDEQQTQRFESACMAANARFIGGMLACIAIAIHELTGADTYFGITPKDIRTPADLMTQGGSLADPGDRSSRRIVL